MSSVTLATQFGSTKNKGTWDRRSNTICIDAASYEMKLMQEVSNINMTPSLSLLIPRSSLYRNTIRAYVAAAAIRVRLKGPQSPMRQELFLSLVIMVLVRKKSMRHIMDALT